MTARTFLRRLMRDTRGVSAVEFAFLAPTIIFMYMGMVEFCQGYMAQKRAAHVASMVGDLTAQNTTLEIDQLANIFAIGKKIIRPFDEKRLDQRITSVVRNGNAVTVVWSQASGELSPLQKDAPYELPTLNLVPDTQGLIIAESEYKFASPINFMLPQPITFRHVSYLRPRSNAAVACSDC